MEREPLWADQEWEEIRDAFRHCVDNNQPLAYFTLARTVDASSAIYESAQRCDFNPDALNRFLDVEGTMASEADPHNLIEPAIAWLKSRAQNSTIGRNRSSFRVQLLGPRGEKKFATLRCTLAYEEPSASPPPKVERAEVEASVSRISRAMEELSAAYLAFNNWQTACTQRLMNVFWDVQSFYERVIRSASGENITLRDELQKFMDSHHQKMNDLHGQLMNVKVEVAKFQTSEEASRVSERRDVELEKARLAMSEKLGGNFIDGLADVGKMVVAAKLQIDPRLMKFLKTASQDEELLTLLSHPEVSSFFEKEGSGTSAITVLKEVLKTPALLQALTNPALAQVLKRLDVKAQLVSGLKTLIAFGEEDGDPPPQKTEPPPKKPAASQPTPDDPADPPPKKPAAANPTPDETTQETKP